jgi:hypothetical protein
LAVKSGKNKYTNFAPDCRLQNNVSVYISAFHGEIIRGILKEDRYIGKNEIEKTLFQPYVCL